MDGLDVPVDPQDAISSAKLQTTTPKAVDPDKTGLLLFGLVVVSVFAFILITVFCLPAHLPNA